MGSRMEWRGPRFWEAGVEGGARNATERSEVRSLERGLPKSVAMGDVHVHAASGVVAPDALSGLLSTNKGT